MFENHGKEHEIQTSTASKLLSLCSLPDVSNPLERSSKTVLEATVPFTQVWLCATSWGNGHWNESTNAIHGYKNTSATGNFRSWIQFFFWLMTCKGVHTKESYTTCFYPCVVSEVMGVPQNYPCPIPRFLDGIVHERNHPAIEVPPWHRKAPNRISFDETNHSGTFSSKWTVFFCRAFSLAERPSEWMSYIYLTPLFGYKFPAWTEICVDDSWWFNVASACFENQNFKEIKRLLCGKPHLYGSRRHCLRMAAISLL